MLLPVMVRLVLKRQPLGAAIANVGTKEKTVHHKIVTAATLLLFDVA